MWVAAVCVPLTPRGWQLEDPVTTPDGFHYSRSAIENWIRIKVSAAFLVVVDFNSYIFYIFFLLRANGMTDKAMLTRHVECRISFKSVWQAYLF
jgi:hypothetical protein